MNTKQFNLKTFTICLLCLTSVQAFADRFIVTAPEVTPGENVELSVALENTNEVAACQLSLYLPEGVSLAKNARNRYIFGLSEDRKDDHVITITDAEDGSFLFAIYSPSNAPLYENEGELFTVTLAIDGSYTGAKDASFKNIVTSTSDEVGTDLDDVTFSLTIKEEPVTITANDLSMIYGDNVPELTYKAEGAELKGNPALSCEANSSSPVGTYPIVIEKGTVTNNQVTLVNGTLTITKAPLTISAGSYSIKQGEALPTFVAEYHGFKNGETEEVLTAKPTLSTTATSASAPGSYEITISGAEAQNYEISYVKGTLTITDADPIVITAQSYTREYGDANPAFEYATSGAALNGTPEISCEANATSPVGTYPIVIRKGSVTNYNDSYVNGTLTITKAPLTIKADTYVKKQGEDNPEFTLIYEGFKNNETASVLTTQPKVSTTAVKESAVGEYEVKVSGAEAKNYLISYVNGKLVITAADAIVITANSYTREYGDANPTFGFTSSGAALNGVPEISCEATATTPVGIYPIIIKKGSVTNYNSTYVNGSLTITKAPLTIKAGEYTKEQGKDNPEFALTYEGFKNNETSAVLTTQPKVTTTAVKDSPIGMYEVIVSSAEAKNYEITYVNGTLNIVVPVGIGEIDAERYRNAVIYNLSGQKLTKPQRGVNIIDGKKVIVR